MTAMHDHIARTFPDVCPMHGPGHAGQPGAGTRPVPAGVGGPVPHSASKAAEDTAPATADDNREALVAKAATLERKLRKARRAAGLEVEITGELVTLEPAAGFLADPDVIKTAVTDATSTLVDQFIAALAERDETSQAELRKLRKEIREVHKVADAIADQPDPGVTAYRGVALAVTPKTSAAPAGLPTMAQRAEHAKAAVFSEMYEQWRTASNPEDRGKTRSCGHDGNDRSSVRKQDDHVNNARPAEPPRAAIPQGRRQPMAALLEDGLLDAAPFQRTGTTVPSRRTT